MELQYYWDILDKSRNIMTESHANKIKIQPEAETLCGIAMANIIRSGYPFSVVDHSVKEEVKKKNILDNFIEEVPDETDIKEDQDVNSEEGLFEKDVFGYTGVTIDIRNDDNVLFSCPESVMKRILRESYRKLILHEEDVETPEEVHVEEDVDVDIDFLEKEEEEKRKAAEEKKRLAEEERLKKEQEDNQNKEDPVFDPSRLPEFEFLSQFPEDNEDSKEYSTFLCNEHIVTFKDRPDISPIRFMIYPLASSQANTLISDIFVIASSEGSIRAGISRGATSAVTMEFDNHIFMIRGSFKDGVFESQINSMNAEEPIETKTTRHVPSAKMACTYTRVAMSDGTLFMFPAVMKDNNKTTGLAEAAIAIQTADAVRVLSPTSDGRFVINPETLLECYWMGDTFYYDFQHN